MSGQSYSHKDWQAYQAGELGGEDAHAFERWMLENPAEADALEGMSAVSDNDLKQSATKVGARIDEMAYKNTKSVSPRIWAAAASVTVLAIMSWWLVGDLSKNDLYGHYYETYTAESGTVRGEEAASPNVYELYANGDYQKGLEAIAHIPTSQIDAEMALIEALCHMELGQYEQALPKFPESGQSPSINEASNWYKALTYLKLGHVGACRSTLKSVAKQKGFYMNEAKQLMKKLDE